MKRRRRRRRKGCPVGALPEHQRLPAKRESEFRDLRLTALSCSAPRCAPLFHPTPPCPAPHWTLHCPAPPARLHPTQSTLPCPTVCPPHRPVLHHTIPTAPLCTIPFHVSPLIPALSPPAPCSPPHSASRCPPGTAWPDGEQHSRQGQRPAAWPDLPAPSAARCSPSVSPALPASV